MKFLIWNKKQCVLAKPFETNDRDTESFLRISPTDYECIPLDEITDSWVQSVGDDYKLIIVRGGGGYQELYVVDSFSSREEGERNMKVLLSSTK